MERSLAEAARLVDAVELAHSPQVWLPDVFGGIYRDTVFRRKTLYTVRPRLLGALQHLSLAVLVRDLVKKRAPLNIRLVCPLP